MKKLIAKKLSILSCLFIASFLLWGFHNSTTVAKKIKYSKSQHYQIHAKYSSIGNGFSDIKKDKVEFEISKEKVKRKHNKMEMTFDIITAEENQGNCEKGGGMTYTLKNYDQKLYFLTVDADGKDALWYNSEEGFYQRFIK